LSAKWVLVPMFRGMMGSELEADHSLNLRAVRFRMHRIYISTPKIKSHWITQKGNFVSNSTNFSSGDNFSTLSSECKRFESRWIQCASPTYSMVPVCVTRRKHGSVLSGKDR
jgi:hypothetical protein